MNQIITYLTFDGNCREAMEFYQQCIGGELNIQTIDQTPEAEKFPENFRQLVVQAALKKDDMLLMGTDMHDEEVLRGNAASILLQGCDKAKIREYFNKLVVGGKPTHPLNKNHWGDLFGGLTDRFGNHWLFHCNQKSQSKTRENGEYQI